MEVVRSGNALETGRLGQPDIIEQFTWTELFMRSMKADRGHVVSLLEKW
jgi:hypothetical protein